MKNRKKADKKTGKKFIAGIILGFIMCGILIFYAGMLQSELDKEIIELLEEVSQQCVINVNKEVTGELVLLEEVADRLSADDQFDLDGTVKELKEICQRYSFKRMGIITPDGNAHTTDEVDMYLGDRKFFEDSMRGEKTLSGKLQDKGNGEDIIVFSVPLYEGDDVCAVLFATYRLAEIQELLFVSVFEGDGYSYVVNRDGDVVVDTSSSVGAKDFRNVYTLLENASQENLHAVSQLQSGMANEESGFIRFHNKVDKYMYYSPVGVRNWYILNVVPTSAMDSTRNFIMLITYVLCGVMAVIFLVFVLYIVKLERQKKEELKNILYVDSITGGYSYAKFCAEIKARLQTIDAGIAYIVMDIDKFKVINELFGYEEGNKTLRFIWFVWKECSRKEELYARHIADKFVGLWYFDTREELTQRLEDFLDRIQQRLPETASEYNLKTTTGVYIVKDKNEDIQSMMNYAVMAHSSVKGQEDAQYAFFDDDFRKKLLQNKLLEDQMKGALKHKEFVVYYQPKYSVDTKILVGAEALVRWKKKDGSVVMPGIFIPLAEDNGFIRFLDKYVFTEVCRKQKEWLEQGKTVVPVSVNLSRRHLYNNVFMDEYKSIIEEIGVPSEYVQLELTESAIFENQEALFQIIDKLHGMGFRILMDDFGTGYSSLMMLKSMPIDILKLDKSFVDDFDDPRGEKIIISVIQLAQALQIEVTAEGVETEEQYKFLKTLGCNTIQGFYFAKPMPEAEFAEMLID